MRRPLARVLLPIVIIAALLITIPVRAAAQSVPHGPDASSPSIIYRAQGHLWKRSVDGPAPQAITTPWPMATNPNSQQSAAWSPDGRRIALDDGRSRLAVIKLDTGHVTVLVGGTCAKNCQLPVYEWSPSGRYLAVLRPFGSGDHSTLTVWDSSRGTMRTLLHTISSFGSGISWSHDSTRIAGGTGAFDSIKSIFPSLTIVDLQGHARTLGKGDQVAWSPDDRLIAAIRPHECGANTCDDAEVTQSSSGGAAVILQNHSNSNFEDVEWAPQPSGYAFDRWLLNASGHVTRRLAGPHERVDAWTKDGSRVAVQSYHPYESTPDALYLSTPQGKRVHLYTAGAKDSCGACSKDVYRVTWSHGGGLIAFITPEYPTPKMVTVLPKIFLTGMDGGTPTQIPVPRTDDMDILGFVENDAALILRSRNIIYRYDISTHQLSTQVSGVTPGPGLPSIDPTAVR